MEASVRLQHLLPHSLLARIVYRASRSKRPWLRRALTRWFARQYRIDLDEVAEPDLERYPTFNAFFTRRLRPDARPLEGDAATLVSPVDGRITEFGSADAGRLIQAKGFDYALEALLGDGPFAIDDWHDASYATIYLAPADYHRVHMPLDGTLVATRYVPGRRFSVNAATTAGIRNLFCRNERVVCWFETPYGPMAVVLVGALNVSSISTINRGEIPSGPPRYWVETPSVRLGRGDELGAFNLGSTVVVVLAGGVDFRRGLAAGDKLQLGCSLGRVPVPATAAEPTP